MFNIAKIAPALCLLISFLIDRFRKLNVKLMIDDNARPVTFEIVTL